MTCLTAVPEVQREVQPEVGSSIPARPRPLPAAGEEVEEGAVQAREETEAATHNHLPHHPKMLYERQLTLLSIALLNTLKVSFFSCLLFTLFASFREKFIKIIKYLNACVYGCTNATIM